MSAEPKVALNFSPDKPEKSFILVLWTFFPISAESSLNGILIWCVAVYGRDLQFTPSVGASCFCVLYVMQLVPQHLEELEPQGVSSTFSFVSI